MATDEKQMVAVDDKEAKILKALGTVCSNDDKFDMLTKVEVCDEILAEAGFVDSYKMQDITGFDRKGNSPSRVECMGVRVLTMKLRGDTGQLKHYFKETDLVALVGKLRKQIACGKTPPLPPGIKLPKMLRDELEEAKERLGLNKPKPSKVRELPFPEDDSDESTDLVASPPATAPQSDEPTGLTGMMRQMLKSMQNVEKSAEEAKQDRQTLSDQIGELSGASAELLKRVEQLEDAATKPTEADTTVKDKPVTPSVTAKRPINALRAPTAPQGENTVFSTPPGGRR